MRISSAIVLALVASSAGAKSTKFLPAGVEGQSLALHCVAPHKRSADAVLFIHGATFPTLLAAGYEFDGKDSWLDFMANRGYLACGLDFLGFGASSRPAAMSEDPVGAAPIDTAIETARQVSIAADYLLRARGARQLHIVAHSWGTVPAALYAATHSASLASLTLFGPVVPKSGAQRVNTDFSWWTISAQSRYEELRFTDVVPAGTHLLEPSVDRNWAAKFAASAPADQHTGAANSLRIPAGPLADNNAATLDNYPYRQGDVRAPVFVVYGSYDAVVNDAEAEAFLGRFTASPLKWRLRIDDGTHVMHLEKNRRSLYQSVLAFIATTSARR